MKTDQQKREEAEQRQRERELRSLQEQLDLIEQRRGESKKEKKRLLERLLEVQHQFHSHGKSSNGK
jgi:hypothetical protein